MLNSADLQSYHNTYQSKFSPSELWLEFKSGNRQAFEQIYRSHFAQLYNYGMTMHPKEPAVKDAIQQLFVDLWQRRSNLSDVDNPASYLIKSLRHKLLSIIEEDKRYDHNTAPENVELEFIPSQEMSMISEQDGSLRRNRIKLLINDLPPRQREVIMLIFFEEKSYEEASAILSMSIQSVYRLVWRAISSLRQSLPR
ncbi:sigma-70 family RNA polymerase sigma factor [Marinoscillum sp. MHG1-6]|uniref:RNA polymerase sigma factor n=1 Tax=Marinoscillum sp. MHG1-6 TaxID=2959627 RepID=UPI00280AFD7E|nr:sigma-70 family RNA polymerase sigma factor [Marinoscillum sp. MHG1-6]